VAGAFREAVDFEQAADGRYYVFDRRGHTVHVVGPGDLARPVVRIGLEEGRILQPAAFDLDPDGTFVVADAPGGRERVQIFSAEGSRINGFLLPGRAAVRVRLGPLVLNGVGSIQYTGRSVLLNQPESGALVTEYSFAGTPLRSFGALRRTGHEADRDVHLALNVGLPLVNPRGGFYFVFLTGVPLVRAFDAQGALRFERHIEGRELDDLVAGLPSVWPRRRGEDGELPLVTPSLRTAAVDRDGNLWVALVPPYVYVYDAEGEKRRTLQLRAPTGVIAPTSLSFSPKTGRLLVTPGCYEFEVR
jgi:DNA-binding beta-propeller fold protein YncE